MTSERLAMEHYRLHSVEQWPDSPYKDAVLAAIGANLEKSEDDCLCLVCLRRMQRARVLPFPRRMETVAPDGMAA